MKDQLLSDWLTLTDWVQDDYTTGKLKHSRGLLGPHRAHIIKAEVDGLRATVARLEPQLAAAQGQHDYFKLRIREHLANRYEYPHKEFCEKLGEILYAAPIQQQPAQQAQPERAHTISVQWLAEMIMSDCGCSTNNQSLLDRIIKRIDQHERANTTQQAQPERAPLSDAEIERDHLLSLLSEVSANFTRDDDLPDDLLPRIDAAIKQGGKHD